MFVTGVKEQTTKKAENNRKAIFFVLTEFYLFLTDLSDNSNLSTIKQYASRKSHDTIRLCSRLLFSKRTLT
jgi:hypothetical protein